MVLQSRDLLLLRGLLESRLMTTAHAAAIYFEGRPEATKKRLQKLKRAGLIRSRSRRVFEADILIITKLGLSLLKEEGVLTEYSSFSFSALEKRSTVSELTLRHELEVMNVKAAFHSALRDHTKLSVAEFGTWPRLYEFTVPSQSNSYPITVRPDGFIRIYEKEIGSGLSEHSFFLEVDRSTETTERLVARSAAYLDFYKTGGFAARNGAPLIAYKNYPFRVLIITKSSSRRDNIARALLGASPPILSHVCLSTIKEITHALLDCIWVRPADYRHSNDEPKGAPLIA